VVNHQGLADILCLYSFVPIRLIWMAKDSLFRIPFFGWAIKGAGTIPVRRDDRKKAMEALFAAAEQIRKGKSIVVFPEGTRSNPDGSMLPFKKGGFVLAKKAGVFVQPITIWGSFRILPVQDRLLPRFYPGTVRVVVHEAISPELYSKLSTEQLSNHVRDVIEEPMQRLRSLISPPVLEARLDKTIDKA